ncbi:hypothetical protein [Fusobacterium sp. MFO224]|uniref:hypothetical protein n=1 Tax=Fusobacterium sp. MFO224 TaxID=3378070 RepID=UPI003851C550
MEMREKKNSKIGIGVIFSVAAVLFSTHAGGGFATGNQETQYFVSSGFSGVISAILAMILYTMTIREAIVMKNSRNLKNYKELFETLYHPFDKVEWIFEIYFHTMVICAVGAVIAGAASLISSTNLINYVPAVFLVSSIFLILTIFGAKLIIKVSSVMSVIILVSMFIIFFIGIKARMPELIGTIENFSLVGKSNVGKLILKAFIYAGFQSVAIPTMISCSSVLKTDEQATKSMIIAFIMNCIALIMAVLMLLAWAPEFIAAGQTTLPVLYVCKNLNITYLYWFYNIALFVCLISTGVSILYGFVSKFSTTKIMDKIEKPIIRRIVSSCLCMGVSISISMLGLSKIVKYGYGYCGYVGIAIIVIPFLTVGVYKNRKFRQEEISEKPKSSVVFAK